MPESDPIRLAPMHEVKSVMTDFVETNGYVDRSGREIEQPEEIPNVPGHPDDLDLISEDLDRES